MCELVGLTRATHYRLRNEPTRPPLSPAEMELRDAIQKIATEWPSYGSRRIARWRQAQGGQTLQELAAGQAAGVHVGYPVAQRG